MKKKVLIFDTSVLCVWLKVPGKETCGPEGNLLTYDIVNAKIEEEKQQGTTFVLPIASIIETGNHIAHSAGDRHVVGHAFADIISATADQISPWAAFTEQSELWKKDNLKVLAERWKENVLSGQAIRCLRQHLQAGRHRLTIYAVDSHIVVDQWSLKMTD